MQGVLFTLQLVACAIVRRLLPWLSELVLRHTYVKNAATHEEHMANKHQRVNPCRFSLAEEVLTLSSVAALASMDLRREACASRLGV